MSRPNWKYEDEVAPKLNGSGSIWAFEEDEEKPKLKSTEDIFETIYTASFYNSVIQSNCAKNLAKDVFDFLGSIINTPPLEKKPINRNQYFDASHGATTPEENIEFEIRSLAVFDWLESLKPASRQTNWRVFESSALFRRFLHQARLPNMAHERIACALALQDFLIRSVEYYKPKREGLSWLRIEMEAILNRLLPIRVSACKKHPNSFKLAWDGNAAYFTVGGLTAAFDQGLNQFGLAIGQRELFSALPVNVYSDKLKGDERVLRVVERFDAGVERNRIFLGFKNITPARAEEDATRLRSEQRPILGSLRSATNMLISFDGNNLIQIALALIFQLRLMETPETVQAFPLTPENPSMNFFKIDGRIARLCYFKKFSPEEWGYLDSFLSASIPAERRKFLESLDAKSLEGSLNNETFINARQNQSLYFSTLIEKKAQTEFRKLSQLRFSKEYLFSETQTQALEANLAKLIDIVRQFKNRSEPSSVLQLFMAFDVDFVRHFVTTLLSADSTFVTSQARMVFHDESLDYYRRVLYHSVSDAELREILYQPKRNMLPSSKELSQLFPTVSPVKTRNEQQHSNPTPPPMPRD